jgi:ribosomal protein S18 acetylase RimI-like enzyme
VIRRARVDDWEAARALWREIDELHAGLAPAYFRPAMRADREWRERLAEPDAAIFVAERDGAVVGFAAARVYETPPDPGMVQLRRGHLEMLIVDMAHRRRGLGQALMEAVTDWARRQRAAELVLTVWEGNREAEAFYERLGYTVLSRVLRAPL